MPRLPLLTLAALALTVSACGADDRVTPEAAVSPHHARSAQAEQPAETDSPSAKPSRSAPTVDPKAAAKPRKGHKPLPAMAQPRPTLDNHLLSAARMPTPAEEVTWEVADSGPEDAVAVGACQKTALEPIGAVSAVRRAFASAEGGAVATQVVGRFADRKSAWRAHEVLRAWQADCEDRLDFARTRVGPLRAVTVGSGTGENYRAAYGPRSAERGWSTGLGIVRQGRYLSVVEILTKRAEYPSERDPARAAVRRIARTFA